MTHLVRRNWEDILGYVKARSKVTWILLSAAEVESATRNVLILRFSKDGEAKGFITAGSDSLLAEALNDVANINPRVIAMSRAAIYEGSKTPSDRSTSPSPTAGFSDEPPF